MKTILSFTLLFSIFSITYSSKDTITHKPFGTNFTLKRTGSGEILTISAFTTDSLFFFLYDLADRSIAKLDSNGTFIKKVILQSIGRETYIGDDFVVRGNEAIFLNAVDYRIEYFDINKGFFIKSLSYPRYIPFETQQRRYRIITRIFLDNSKIFIGNGHAVFPIDENVVLQKTTAKQVRKFPSSSLLLLFRARNPVMYKTGKIEWNQSSIPVKNSGYPLLGKQFGILSGKLFLCNVDNTGITILSTGLTE